MGSNPAAPILSSMKVHSESHFLSWASSQGLGLDPRYPKSNSLIFLPDTELARFWVVPAEPERRPYFLRWMLDAFGVWSSYYCWRHLGVWPGKPDEGRPNDQIEHAILHGLGLPEGGTDVIEFDASEKVQLITLLLSTTIFGWSVGEDLILVPDTARGTLKISHHTVVHASFKEEKMMLTFIREMEEAEFPLPTEVPDATFKVPSWMTT